MGDNMKDLAVHLDPPSDEQVRAQGAAGVLAMMRRHAAKQKQQDG